MFKNQNKNTMLFSTRVARTKSRLNSNHFLLCVLCLFTLVASLTNRLDFISSHNNISKAKQIHAKRTQGAAARRNRSNQNQPINTDQTKETHNTKNNKRSKRHPYSNETTTDNAQTLSFCTFRQRVTRKHTNKRRGGGQAIFFLPFPRLDSSSNNLKTNK